MESKNNYGIRKQTGHERTVSPLKKAFDLYCMMKELRGLAPDDGHHAHIRRIVGKLK
jgi:hypothetical protein